MTYQTRLKLDREATTWFNNLVCGFSCYHPDRWKGHPQSYMSERGLGYHRLLQLSSAFEMRYGFKPDPYGKVPPPRKVHNTYR